jgi:hypothetical protein
MKNKTPEKSYEETSKLNSEPLHISVWILGILSSSAILLFSVLLLTAKLRFEQYPPLPPSPPLPLLLLMTAITGGMLFCVFYTGCCLWHNLSQLRKRLLIGVFIFLSVITQIVIALSLFGKIAYDFNYLFHAARELANGNGMQPYDSDYFAQFPNNRFLMLCFELIFRIYNMLGLQSYYPSAIYLDALTVVNVLMVDLTILFSVLSANKMFGRKIAWLSLLLLVPTLGFHRGIVLPYSDTFCILFPIVFLYLYVTLSPHGFRRWSAIFFMALCLIIGINIKPQAGILPIAILIYESFSVKKNKQFWLSSLKTTACFILTAIILSGAFQGYANLRLGPHISEELEEKLSIPATHYLMMGMNDKHNGFINSEDYQATLSYPTKAEKVQYNLNEIRRRFQKFGVTGYVKFLWRKHSKIFETARMDMWIREPFHAIGPLGESIRKLIYYTDGALPFYDTALQSGWLILFFFILLPALFNRRKNVDQHVIILRLTVIGLWIFLLLFEAGQRYLFHQIPIFCILAAWGMCNFKFTAWFKRQKALYDAWVKLSSIFARQNTYSSSK